MTLLERLKQVNSRGAPEESVALRVAVLASVVAAGLAVLPHGVGGAPLALAVVLGIPGAFWFSYRARYAEGFWLKVALALGVLLAFGAFLRALAQTGSADLAGAQIPLAELFCWVQFLHSFDVPARRDLLFSLVSSLVLMAVAGVLSISMDLLPYLLAWAVAAVASLVLAYRSQVCEVPPLAPVGAGPEKGSFPARGRMAAPVAATLAVVTLVGTGAFLVVPPAGEARALTFPRQLEDAVALPDPGGLANPSLGDGDPGGSSRRGRKGRGRASFGYFGFSDTLDLATRGRPDDTLVMRVRSGRRDFWRGQTFDVWDGQRWTISDARTRPVAGEPPLDIPPAAGEEHLPPGPELVQTFYLERPGPNVVFAAPSVATLYFPDRRVFQLSDGTLRAGVALEDEAVYTVVSRRPAVSEAILRNSDGDAAGVPTEVAERYTQLPVVPHRVHELARQVTASAPSVYDKVRALEAWMAANVQYSLDIPPLPAGADAVEHFLFEARIGFCEQIGTSLVVMLRALGIPARLAVGYTPGERNPFTGLYEVRARDAHSWAEVWFPGVGWQAFDPTASVPLADEAEVPRAGSGLLSYLSARLPQVPPWAVPALSVLAVGATVAAGLGGLAGWWRRRRRRAQRSWADACLARLEAVGEARGRRRRPAETAAEYAAAVRAVTADARLVQVGEILRRDAFSLDGADPAERAWVDVVLDEAAGRTARGAGRHRPARARTRP